MVKSFQSVYSGVTMGLWVALLLGAWVGMVTMHSFLMVYLFQEEGALKCIWNILYNWLEMLTKQVVRGSVKL